MKSNDAYLQELLRRYQANFDITENFILGETTYPAYAWFYSLSEKYVLKKEAQLWAIKAFEHVLFIKKDCVTAETLTELMNVVKTEAEPALVRKHNKYPEKDHMCSYITFIVLTADDPDKKVSKAIKRFHFDKGYLFNFRGHCEVRLAVVSMKTGNILTNYSGRDLKKLLADVYISSSASVEYFTKSATDSIGKTPDTQRKNDITTCSSEEFFRENKSVS